MLLVVWNPRGVAMSSGLWFIFDVAFAGSLGAIVMKQMDNVAPLRFQAAAFQWVNPKAWTMALTAASAYIPADSSRAGLLMGTSLRRFLSDPVRMRRFNIVAGPTPMATVVPILLEHK